MAYLAIGIIFGFVILLHKIVDGADERNERKVEQIHKEGYALVDKYYGDRPYLARAKKAEIDAMVHGEFAKYNRTYEPKELSEVTTSRERKKYEKDGYSESEIIKAKILDAIDEAQIASFTEEDLIPYMRVTYEEGIERCARSTAEFLGISYEEARQRVIENDKRMGITEETFRPYNS